MGADISIITMARMDRVDKQGRVPLLLRIDLRNKPVAYDKCGEKAYKVPVEFWDQEAKLVNKKYPNATQINLALSKRKVELEGMFLAKEQLGVRLTAQRIKHIVDGIDPGRCFYAFCEKQIIEKYDNDETRRTYRSEVSKLKEYRAELTFGDIDFEFLQGCRAWMRDTRKNKPNTIWKTFKFMRTMVGDALKMKGIIAENPFDEFDRGTYKQTRRTWLSQVERLKLEQLLHNPLPDMLQRVLVYQLFMCYAGLRFEDAMAFDYNQHIIDGERLIMNTEKEDEMVNVKLYPKLREILVLVREYPLQIANQTFNKHIKIAQEMAGVEKNLSAHVGRHTFGRMLAENGVDIKKAQKLLAHRDERSTKVYYHLIDKDVDKEVDEKLENV